MKIERTKNTVRSIAFGFIYKILCMVMPFTTRTIILYFLGADYLGLGSLFSSILSFLSLAEMGFCTAIVYSMYKPIANNDNKTICALLNLYKKIYRYIGLVILLLGLILIPFLRKIIHGDIPSDVNLTVLYLIYLTNTLSSYFLFAYRGSLLTAHQRNDIDSRISVIIVIVQYVLQIGVLIIFKNYYAYVVMLPLATIATNFARLFVVKKMYPEYKAEGKVDKKLFQSIKKKVIALIGTKLNTVVLNASDNIVMSAFLGLTVIAIYNNYHYIFTAISGIVGIIYSSMTAGLGNSLAIESKEKNYNDFLKFSFLNAWIVGWCSICLLCLYQPFMYIWTNGKLLFPNYTVVGIVVYFYLYMIRKIPVIYKDAGGIWWEDRFRPYVCMIVNIIVNIILVNYIGVIGIVLSTILSLIISIPWENYTIFKYIFNMSSKEYYKKMITYLLMTIGSGALTLYFCSFFEYGWVGLIVRGIICIFLPNIIWVSLNIKRKEFSQACHLLLKITHIDNLLAKTVKKNED